MKLKVGDTVIVISGAEKGKTGEIVKILHKENKVVVDDINKVTKHLRPSQNDPDGGIMSIEAPLDASKVAYYDEKAKAPVKLGYKFEDGKKVRFNKKTGKVID